MPITTLCHLTSDSMASYLAMETSHLWRSFSGLRRFLSVIKLLTLLTEVVRAREETVLPSSAK